MKEMSDQAKDSSQKEYIYETIGGPKLYYNKRRKINPRYIKKKDGARIAEKFYQDFIISLRTERIRQGITQKTVAHELGTHQSVISKFEQAITNPTVSFIIRYAHVLNKKVTIKTSP